MRPSFITIALAAMLACQPVLAAEKTSSRAPVSDFFFNPSQSLPVLSPDARFVAMATAKDGESANLAVLDIAKHEAKVVVAFTDEDVNDIRWISNERIVFGTSRGQHYAVNRDGTVNRMIIAGRNLGFSGHYALPFFSRLLPELGKQDSNEIIVSVPKYLDDVNLSYVELMRMDTVTRTSKMIKREGMEREWMLDEQGEPRLSVSEIEGKHVIAWRNPATDMWETIASAPILDPKAIHPVGFAPDGSLYVAAQNGDKSALYRFDLATKKLADKPLLAVDGYDFHGSLVTRGNELVGVRYVGDTWGTYWLDAKLDAIQKKIDAQLPDTVNMIDIAARAATPTVLVTAHSDQIPDTFYLYDTELNKLTKLGSSHPKIKQNEMGHQALVRIKARDGMDVPVFVTQPAGAARKNLPMVVLMYRDPFSRGAEYGWRPDAQFLASRGYLVLEPETRGTLGYGITHARAGWKQWGLAIQDDIADATKWAVAQGLADPQRICIAGTGYGGYTALMGLIKDPALFKCAVVQDALTDFELLIKTPYGSGFARSFRQYGLPAMVGDLEKDAERFNATSPVVQAKRVTQPVLMAYLNNNANNVYHGTKFRDAAKSGNKNIEWVEYDRYRENWAKYENRIDFWTRVEQFLDKNIGKP